MEILRNLEKEFDSKYLPSDKTIGRILTYRRPLFHIPWVPTDMPGEDARLVLESLATTDKGMGLRNAGWPTNWEADRILWLRKAAPTLPAVPARIFAGYYSVSEDDPDKRQILDWMISYRIWRSKAAWDEYRRMINNRKIPGLDKNSRIYHCIAFEYMGCYPSYGEENANGEAQV